MQVFGFRERHRSALCCYTHRFSKLRCAISLFLICTTQFRNRANLAAQFRNRANLAAQFRNRANLAAQFRNCVSFVAQFRNWFAVSKVVGNFEIGSQF